MNNTRESETARITRQSKDILNKNGYSFHYSVIRELNATIQKWKFYGAEIPVSTRGKNIHIDLVFQDTSSLFYLIGECKRVQPNFSDWVFVKTPFTSRKDNSQPPLVLENLQELRGDVLPEVKKVVTHYSKVITPDIYGLGFKVKKHLQENEIECQENIDVIDKSVEQVLRSTSGFINKLSHIVRPSNEVGYSYNYYFLPVIFTTANLWVSDTNIGEADLTTGNLAELTAVKEVPYIWFNYNRPRELSPGFREFIFYYNQPFAIQTQAPFDSVLKEAANYGTYGFEYEEFTRSVLIINSSNLEKTDIFD
jgi:hypothetical protein